MSLITVLDKGNVPIGPFTREQVAAKLQNGEISPTDLAFVDGLAQWTPLSDVLARIDGTPLIPIAAPQPPAVPGYSYAATMEPPPHLVYGDFWPRVGAHILDNFIVSIPFIIVWFAVVASVIGFSTIAQLSRQNGNQPAPPSVALIITIVLLYLSLLVGRIVIVWLYHAILESGPHQATWGKRVVGLKVTSVTGHRITFGHASARYFSTILTGMTMGIGYLMVAFTERKQALHDMIAGTLVVRK